MWGEPQLRGRRPGGVRAGAGTGRGEGAPVVLVPGLGAVASAWLPLMRALRGLRCYAVELPGFGGTDPVDYRGITDFRRYAVEYLAALLDALGIASAPLVGGSMGGLWSAWLALDRPERVSGLVLMGTPAGVLDTSTPVFMRLLTVPLLGELLSRMQPGGAKLWKVLGHGQLVTRGGFPSGWYELTDAAKAAKYAGSAYLGMVRRVATLRGMAPGIGLSGADLRRISQPVALLVGTNDPFAKADTFDTLAEVLRGQVHRIEGGGHLPWLDDPRLAADLVGAVVHPSGGVASPADYGVFQKCRWWWGHLRPWAGIRRFGSRLTRRRWWWVCCGGMWVRPGLGLISVWRW